MPWYIVKCSLCIVAQRERDGDGEEEEEGKGVPATRTYTVGYLKTANVCLMDCQTVNKRPIRDWQKTCTFVHDCVHASCHNTVYPTVVGLCCRYSLPFLSSSLPPSHPPTPLPSPSLCATMQARYCKGPFTLAIFAAILAEIFAAISSAISNRLSKLLAIQIAAESPVVYTGDLKSPRNRSKNCR